MFKKLGFLVFLSFLVLSNASAQKNISLLGNMKFPGKTLAGVWHYVDQNNKEYALVGTSTGLSIVDVSVPSSPNLLFDVPANSSIWREVKTYSHYAYVTTEGGGGITIVDLDSLPLAVNYKTYTGDGTIAGLLGKSHSLQIEGNYLYINGPTGLAGGGILICDLTDPWNPVYVGEENLKYVHDCYVRNDTLWASEIINGQFSVFDITNKANPVLLATQPTPGAFNHNAWLSDNGRYLFTTDEHPNTPLGVFDVSDLNNIKQVDLYYTTLNPSAEVHNVRVFNDFLINPSYGNASYGAQITICDAARPSNIIETGNYQLGGASSTYYISWDASPFLPSGNIIATEFDSGLFILAPVYTRACYLEGIVTDSITGSLLNNVIVEILTTPVMDSTYITGEYKTGMADPGTFSVKFTKSGYLPKTINNVTLTNGVLTTLNVQLWDGFVGISNQNNKNETVKIYPNPFSEFTTLSISPEIFKTTESVDLTITDLTGRKIKSVSKITASTQRMDCRDLEKGVYFYSIVTNKGTLPQQKLVIE